MTIVIEMGSPWLEPTLEQIEWCHVMCLIPTVCPCNADAWALVNDYPHTSAECECVCHDGEAT